MLKQGSMQDLIHSCNKVDEVILFGAGKRIERFEKMFSNTELINKISIIIDNDKQKNGKRIEISGRSISVRVPDEIRLNSTQNYLIIITTVLFGEIVTYLENSQVFRNYDIYVFSQILAFEDEKRIDSIQVPSNKRFSNVQLIPKKIHYCWFGKNPIPDRYKKWMESWRKFCPNYEIIEWNENNYDITKNKYMYQAYQNKKWAFVPDYARLDIIYNEGGIYLDTDVELVKNLDDFLYQDGFAGFESEKNVALGLGFGARKGLSIIRELRDQYEGMEFKEVDSSRKLVASPVIQTSYLLDKGLKQNGSFQIIDGLSIYPEKVLCGKSMTTGKIIIDEETRSIHHYDGSWLDVEHKEKVCASKEELKRYFSL